MATLFEDYIEILIGMQIKRPVTATTFLRYEEIGFDGLARIATAIEKDLGVTFAPAQSDLWVTVQDVIDAANRALVAQRAAA